jgi:hypothetical protein
MLTEEKGNYKIVALIYLEKEILPALLKLHAEYATDNLVLFPFSWGVRG